MGALLVWRHPKPMAVQGRCIGRTDVAVDPRKTKRLAHRIRQRGRREALPRIVFTSPLRRSADVGRWLARWGWRHHIDARLAEMDFGDWEGCAWDDIGAAAVDTWCRDFAEHRAGGGESVARLLHRCTQFLETSADTPMTCVVGHAGWISAARWLTTDGSARDGMNRDGSTRSGSTTDGSTTDASTTDGLAPGRPHWPTASEWPAALPYAGALLLKT